MYRRLVPLVGAERTGPPPPNAVLWLATRLHPAFRRRERLARKTLAERPYLDIVAGWYAGEREAWIDRNLAMQAIEPTTLDDAALAHRLEVLDDHLVQGWMRHHDLHGSDLGPIGDLLAHGRQWGLDPVAVMGLLRGASPATLEGQQHGRRMADALAAVGVDPSTVTSIAEIRAVPDASAALDDYLELFGWRVVTSYDLEGLTTGELPSATCALVRACASEGVVSASADPAAVRALVPESDRPLFDDLLDDARPRVRHARRQRTADRRMADGAAATRLPRGGQSTGWIRAAAGGRSRLRARHRRGRGDPPRRIEPKRRGGGSTSRAAPPTGRGDASAGARPTAATARHLGVPTGDPPRDERHHRRRVQPRGRPVHRFGRPARSRDRRRSASRSGAGRHRSRSSARRHGARRRPRGPVDGADVQRGAGDRRRRRRAGRRPALSRRRDGSGAGDPCGDRLPTVR